MKKLMIIFLSCFMYFTCYAQAPLCEPNFTLTLGNSIPLEYIPTDFTDDIWGSPGLIEDKDVYFIHGLGGEGDDDGSVGISWSQASLFAESNYYINSHRPDYADVSLDFAAMELKSDLEQIESGDMSSFIIAHSQGGIVSRRIDYAYFTNEFGTEPRKFGGIATFGSPHQGAMVLNNKEDLMDWSGTTCSALLSGPLSELVETNFFLDLFLDNTTQAHFEDFFCGTLENSIAPILFKDYFSGITESYEVGSEQIAELNAFTPEIPYVCFYGVETEPVMWNSLIHIMPGHEPNNVITYGEEPFGAAHDFTLIDYSNVMANKYYSKYLSYDNLAQTYSDILYGVDLETILCYLSIFCVIETYNNLNEAELIRDEYEKGYNWFVDANYHWKGFIGALDIALVATDCNCIELDAYGNAITDQYPASPDGSCATEDLDTDCWVEYSYDIYTKESDGVVLVESASECLGQIANEPGYNRKMLTSNHFSMRNDHLTEAKLTELFDGHHGDFFLTLER